MVSAGGISGEDREARLAAARLNYAARLRAQAGDLTMLAGALPASAADLRDFAHRINGTAGSYGFLEVSGCASALEALLAADADSGGAGRLAMKLARFMEDAKVPAGD